MTTMRKFVAALVLGLVMCLAMLTTGAFAQSAHRHFGFPYLNVSAQSVAIADTGSGFGGFGDFFGDNCGFPVAIAHANVHFFGLNGWY